MNVFIHIGYGSAMYFHKSIKDDGSIASLWINSAFRLKDLKDMTPDKKNAKKFYLQPDDLEAYRQSRLFFDPNEFLGPM